VLQKKIFEPAGVVAGSGTSIGTIESSLYQTIKCQYSIRTLNDKVTLKISAAKKIIWASRSGGRVRHQHWHYV